LEREGFSDLVLVSVEEREWASPGSGEGNRLVLGFALEISGSCLVAVARETAERPPMPRDRVRSFLTEGAEVAETAEVWDAAPEMLGIDSFVLRLWTT
jgi:hypothetical protein